jgi:nicotinamidase-related amidase
MVLAGRGDKMKPGLILIDIQNDYFAGGNLELVDMEHSAENAKKLLASFRNATLPLFHIQHISTQPDATFFQPNTAGVEINESVLPQSDEIVIKKHFPNGFRETDLFKNLRSSEVEVVVICGAMSHMCIDATTRAAFDFGFDCIVIEDACTTRDLRHKGERIEASKVHGAFMSALSARYAKVISADEYLDRLKKGDLI